MWLLFSCILYLVFHVFLVLNLFLSVLNWCIGPMELVQRSQGGKIFAPFFHDLFLGSGYFAVDGNLPSETILL